MIQKIKEKIGFRKKYFKNKLFLNILFFGGFFLTGFEVYLYRNTIIDWKIPTFIWFFGGLIVTPFFRKVLNKFYNAEILLLQIVYNLVAFGGIFVFSFMAINFYSENSNLNEKEFEIIKKKSTRRNQIIIINYDGKEKELYFSKYKKREVKNAKNIILCLKDGRLGYEVIENYRLN